MSGRQTLHIAAENKKSKIVSVNFFQAGCFFVVANMDGITQSIVWFLNAWYVTLMWKINCEKCAKKFGKRIQILIGTMKFVFPLMRTLTICCIVILIKQKYFIRINEIIRKIKLA